MVFISSQVTKGAVGVVVGRSWEEIQKSRHEALVNFSFPFKNETVF